MLLRKLEPSDATDQYVDVIVCGAGTAGSVIARRLSDNPDLNVLLIAAGDLSYSQVVKDAARWPQNIGGPEDWASPSNAESELNGQSILMSMGKVVGDSSSINAMVWARGHRQD